MNRSPIERLQKSTAALVPEHSLWQDGLNNAHVHVTDLATVSEINTPSGIFLSVCEASVMN